MKEGSTVAKCFALNSWKNECAIDIDTDIGGRKSNLILVIIYTKRLLSLLGCLLRRQLNICVEFMPKFLQWIFKSS